VRGAPAESLVLLIGRLRRRRVVAPGPGPVRVNLGSSLLVAPGWINIDGSLSALAAGWPAALQRLIYRMTSVRVLMPEHQYLETLRGHRFVHHLLEYGIPLPSRCADAIFSSHLLEHLSRGNGERLLREAWRVLRPGGRIRVAVPDLEEVMVLYRAGRKQEALQGLFAYSEAGFFARHRYMYDFDLLRDALLQAGFTDIERCTLGQGQVPDLALLDNRPESLFVEAARPAER
jgi:SAM-dependent methyltransferase